jgi:hypothetical protein
MVPDGSKATLKHSTTAAPSFTADKAGTYIVALVVNDGIVDSAADYVVVTTLNSKPVADAGADQQTVVGRTVTLDGSGSSDADDNPLSYSWSLTRQPPNSTAVLNPLDQVRTSLTPDRAGDYVAQLIVNDGTVASDPDTALIEVAAANQPPEITPGPVTKATVGQLYSYQVTATDPDAGDTLTYSLRTKPEGMTIGTTTGLIQWTPTESQIGDHSVQVRVTDSGGLFDEQDFVVTVEEAAPTNQAPQVDAGADRPCS